MTTKNAGKTRKTDPVSEDTLMRVASHIVFPARPSDVRTLSHTEDGVTVTLTAGEQGMPYGRYPRLLLMWMGENFADYHGGWSTRDLDAESNTLFLGRSFTNVALHSCPAPSEAAAHHMEDQLERITGLAWRTDTGREWKAFTELHVDWQEPDFYADRATPGMSWATLTPEFIGMLRKRGMRGMLGYPLASDTPVSLETISWFWSMEDSVPWGKRPCKVFMPWERLEWMRPPDVPEDDFRIDVLGTVYDIEKHYLKQSPTPQCPDGTGDGVSLLFRK